MRQLKKRVAILEKHEDAKSWEPMTITLDFTGFNGKVSSSLIMYPDGSEEWKEHNEEVKKDEPGRDGSYFVPQDEN